MNRRSTSVAANPVLIGAATVLVVIVAVFLAYNANNGLPFVPTYKLWCRCRRGEPRDRQRGADRRRPRRDHRQDRAESRTRRLGHGEAAREARDDASSRCRSTRRSSCARARRSASSTSRSRAGTRRQEASRTARRCRSRARRRSPSRSTSSSTCSTSRRARRTRSTCASSATRSPAAAVDINDGDRRARPAATKNVIPVLQNLADPNTRLRQLLPALERTAAAVAPVARAAGPLFRNLGTTFDAFAAIARPFLQDTISGGPRGARHGDPLVPDQRPFLANAAGFFRDLQPGARALRTPLRRSRTRSTSARRGPPRRRAQQASSRARCARCRRSRRIRRCRSASTGCAARSRR